MTTRRTFLGVLTVAPIAAPAIARAGMAEVANGGFISGEALHAFGIVGEHCESFPLSASQSRAFEVALTARPHNQELSTLLHMEAPWRVPNRLYGTWVNEDGEAV